MKEIVMLVSGFIGGVTCHLFGCWDKFIEALLVFMLLDYISGFITAAFFYNSPKSASGRLWSFAMFKGLCKKGMMMLFVIVGYKLDELLGTSYVRSAVVFALIANELLSIIENAGRMGIPIPNVIKKMIDTLNHNEVKKEA